MKTFGLDELLAPLTQDEFFKSVWPEKPLFIPAVDGKLKELFEIPQLQNLEALVAARHSKVRACLPDFDDEYSSIHVEPKDALKVYDNNMTLVFDNMQLQNATIANALRQIRSELGLPMGTEENNLCKARSIAYATPAGCGTRLHFDANVNFIVQLHGSKSWKLVANTSVKNPTERYTASSFEMSAALEKQCHDMLIDEVPDDTEEILMEPGCVLMVPRGYWHETTTSEESLSLNFTFSQPSWADIFTKSMQEHLLQNADWRELADGLESLDEKRKALAVSKFKDLVKKLASEFSTISGKYLLNESGFLNE